MSDLLSGFLGNAGKTTLAVNRRIAAATPLTYRASSKGYLALLAVAGAGTGGRASGGAGSAVRATGGGAGECAIDIIPILPGDTYTITPGAGGAALAAANSVTNGNAGADTVITGPSGYSLTVKGGQGGLAASTAVALAGGAGGTGGTGGSAKVRRYTGGAGGSISAAVTGAAATGGGAVNVFGGLPDACRGGNLTTDVSSATGGGGVGGHGGDAANGGGGGSGGDGSAGTGGPSIVIAGIASDPSLFGITLDGVGSVSNAAGGAGAGGGPVASGTGGAGGIFGGGGGSKVATTTGTGGAGGYGAGSGGGVAAHGSSPSAASNKGGDGIVILVEITDFS